MSTAVDDARLFASFLDPVEMVMSCEAEVPLAEVGRRAGGHGLRFPLVCDPALPLQAHITAVDYAPSSARFGPYVDNVLGMNWELLSGRVVRIGERVIKSTTGYDLLRFLLHSDGRYGRARSYVLRLRPLGGNRAGAVFRGDDEALERVRIALVRSPWIHWIDSVNLRISHSEGSDIEAEADCAAGEQAVFDGFFAEVSREAGATLSSLARAAPAGLPALSIKTTVTAATAVARRLVSENGGEARVLCVNGVVHYFPPAGRCPPSLLELASQCASDGGHMMGPWAPVAPPQEQEAVWAATLETTWKKL